MAAIFKGGAYVLPVQLAALGTAAAIDVPVPFAGRISRVSAVSDAAQTSGISTVTLKLEDGATDLDIASIAFPADYVASTYMSDDVLTNSFVEAGDVLRVATDGTGDGAGELYVAIFIEV
jgi:hypothetical protein